MESFHQSARSRPSPEPKDSVTLADPSSPAQVPAARANLGGNPVTSASSPAMIFSDFYKSPRSPLSKLRTHHPQLPAQMPTECPDWVSDEYADLLSKDKLKQKEAVKRYLDDKVRNDWAFAWPPQHNRQVPTAKLVDSAQATTHEDAATNGNEPQQANQQDSTSEEQKPPSPDAGYKAEEGTELDESISDVDDDDDDHEGSADDASSVYSIVSQDTRHYRPRMEWTSDLSDDGDDDDDEHDDDDVGGGRNTDMVKKARRRRQLREEMSWNNGLACFEARRNAWTGARIVRVRTKPTALSATSPKSPRRFFFRRSMSGSPPSHVPAISQIADMSGATSDSSSVAAKDSSDKDLKKVQTADSSVSESLPPHLYPVETMLPIGQPLLPPNNPLRASISPPVYLSLYDKVIMHNLQPACPINLADMLRSCVAGWKRDGEWPPRPAQAEPSTRARKKKKTRTTSSAGESGSVARRMSFGLLGRDKDDEPGTGKGIRRSLQRALGMGAAET